MCGKSSLELERPSWRGLSTCIVPCETAGKSTCRGQEPTRGSRSGRSTCEVTDNITVTEGRAAVRATLWQRSFVGECHRD